ncbi:MAG TPA: hypothetical protein VF407_24675, partial [Polyangiaceae bacterium]
QVRYWKDRRNDCAHSKRNQVMSAHVEAFWAFMQSNLGRFVPNGSIADLLARLERHFDPNQTPPGQTLEPIVRTIPSCVPAVDLPKLMSDVQSQLSRTIGSRTIPRTMEQISFYDAIFASGQQPSILALVNHLAGQPEFFAAFTRSHPERLPFFATNASLVRELWRKYLFAGGVGELSLFAALLRNNLVPAGQIKEACERAVAGLNGDIPTAVDIPDLLRAGWVEEFRVQAFGSAKKVDEFAWGNRNAAVIQWFLMYEQISPDVAKVLCATFGSTPYPNTVRDTLRDFFASDSTKKTEFIAAAAAAGATPPPSLI